MARDNHYDNFKKNKSSKLRPLRHGLENLFLKGMLGIAGLFSIPFNQALGRGIGSLAYRLSPKDRGIADYQLSFAFPDMSDEDRKKLVRDCFRNFGQTLMEITSLAKFRQNPEKWIHLENTESVHRVLDQGKGAIFLFGHFGNWELMTIIYEMMDIKGKAIGRPVDAVKINEVLRSLRRSSHLEIIERGEKASGRKMLECFRNNEVLLLGLDQDTKAQSVFVDFFGKPAKTPMAAATFAEKFNVPVFAAFGLRNPDGTHTFYFEELITPPYDKSETSQQELTQVFSSAMEQHIRKDPSQWAWFHRRWKTQPDEEKKEDS